MNKATISTVGPEPARSIRAAQYVRMSTEHQKYSTENQAEIIARYAAQRGFEIVETYADNGKSGLRLDGRDALKRLIADVQTGRTDFEVVLVYDVSRWGRFQDADESAYYEFLCREAGISIHYCAEQFENDGSLSATIIKSMKRAMAGEYSRELSVKVFTGQCRLIGLGYRQGGPAGYGLRRQLVDEQRRPKATLTRGEHKSLQTDRVVLTPGPADEIDVVQRIYRMFVLNRRSEREIAALLNGEGLVTDLGRSWTRGVVHQILTNEKYIGNNVYNRVSFKLKNKRVVNAPDMWVRADGAFEGIVDPDFFAAAQRIIAERCRRYTDTEMLERLTELLERRGCLSGLIIDELEDMPSSSTYRQRFGSLMRAYELVGWSPSRDYRYLETNRFLRRWGREQSQRSSAWAAPSGSIPSPTCSPSMRSSPPPWRSCDPPVRLQATCDGRSGSTLVSSRTSPSRSGWTAPTPPSGTTIFFPGSIWERSTGCGWRRRMRCRWTPTGSTISTVSSNSPAVPP